jgi:ferrochelatase
MQAGGVNYKHIPCLNDNDQWVDVVCNWIKKWENSIDNPKKGEKLI